MHMNWPRQERYVPASESRTQARTGKKQSRIVDERLAHKSWGLTYRMSAKLFLTDLSKQNPHKTTGDTEYKGSRVMAEP
jgi:hypothetical protein